MKRIVWIDYAKSLAIFLVVLLHVHATPGISKTINGMIMPLFFILSGYLFSYDRNPAYSRFAVKRARQLLVPYLWINIVAWGAWVLVLRRFGSDAADALDPDVPLRGIFTGTAPLLVHDIPLWSLLSFFVVEMVFYPIGKSFSATLLTGFGALCVSIALGILFPEEAGALPLVVGPSVAGLVFYSLGHAWRLSEERGKVPQWLFSPVAAVIYIAVFSAACAFNGNVDFYICDYGGDYALFFLSSLSGSLAAISLMKMLARGIGTNRFIRFVSDGTLIICGFHLLVFAMLKGIALFLFGLQPSEITEGAWRGVSFAVVAFMGTLPVVWFVRRFMRPLVDK